MDIGESIDSLFARFADIVNPLKSLGKSITNEQQVVKLLYSLRGAQWIQKRQIVEATTNLSLMTFEGLMGNLKACEVQMEAGSEGTSIVTSKSEGKKPKEEPNVAFKTWKPRPRRVVESSDSEDEGVEELIRKFSKALMKKIGQSSGNCLRGSMGRRRKFLHAIGAINWVTSSPCCPLGKKDKGKDGEAIPEH